jgi:hypothetical protein
VTCTGRSCTAFSRSPDADTDTHKRQREDETLDAQHCSQIDRIRDRALAAAAAVGTGTVRAASDAYIVNPPLSGGSTTAPLTDPSLVNGWGLSAGPTTPWWASDNGTNLSTLYSGTGAKTALTVSVPGSPIGTVFNGSATEFVVSQNGASGAARFLFATESGTILRRRREPARVNLGCC